MAQSRREEGRKLKAWKKYPKLTAGILSCLVCIAATATICFFVFGEGDKYDRYEEIEAAIRDTYVGELDETQLQNAVSRAMVESLGDPWSYYMTAEEYAAFQQRSANRGLSIGIVARIDWDMGLPAVVSVAEDSSAARAGITVGQYMVALDGKSLTGIRLDGLWELIGDKGDKSFTLTVMNGQGASRVVTLQAEDIYVPPVWYEMLDYDIGYVCIQNFEDGSAAVMKEAVELLMDQGASSLILDVRNNPGGKVSELIDALDFLLPRGELFVSVERDGTETLYRSDASHIDLPMVVLINEESYSAAEFFAAALWEHKVAVLIGEQTTGKGRSQTTVELSDGSAVHLSNKTYLTPSGMDLTEAGGLKPDIAVEDMEDSELDVPLRTAINHLVPVL